MNLDVLTTLRRLGAGEPIASVSSAAGISRTEFDSWWRDECRKRVPAETGTVTIDGLHAQVSIQRDQWGVPRIEAKDDHDLFVGYGYAVAQDRLFQLDYLRRKARGRLAEILGPDALESDLLYRTLGLARTAESEWKALVTESRKLLEAYCAGINAWIQAAGTNLPIEFDLLAYRPEPWSPTDSLAVAGEFRWYLTGRFHIIVVPELVKRALSACPLYEAFLQGEADGESILPPHSYRASPGTSPMVGATVSDQDEGQGSNNWVLAGSRTRSGHPLIANDPHLPFAAVSMFHEVHLRGGSFHVAGAAYTGVPGIMAGRNERVAWGLTNNICSVRDLYLEKTDPKHPGCFLFDGEWEPARERQETIQVRGAVAVVKLIRSSRNGPIVDEVLPAPGRTTGPVALRWLGAEPCGWLTALLDMTRARTVREFADASRPWKVPTFNLVCADVDGHIGHQCVGQIPVRQVAERAYRPGWDPRHQWRGTIPFEEMPRQIDPPRGFAVSANNRLAPDDYPYPLSGTWSSGHRARRIRERIEETPQWTEDDTRRLHRDIRSGRAAACVPHLVEALREATDPSIRHAVEVLASWDYQVGADSCAATIFNVFFSHWCRTVVASRMPSSDAGWLRFVADNASGLAASLLVQDAVGWFAPGQRSCALNASMRTALDELERRLGPEKTSWAWGRLHTLTERHFLSGRGDLGELLDRSGLPLAGDTTTVCNTTPDAGFAAYLGPTFRMMADLGDPRLGLHSVGIPGNSGHPGSPHYDDQLRLWEHGEYRTMFLREDLITAAEQVLLPLQRGQAC